MCSAILMRMVLSGSTRVLAGWVGASGAAAGVAATVAVIAIVGTIPYIALQLKAVSSSLSTVLAQVELSTGAAQPIDT